jgi:hypothetical protein
MSAHLPTYLPVITLAPRHEGVLGSAGVAARIL